MAAKLEHMSREHICICSYEQGGYRARGLMHEGPDAPAHLSILASDADPKKSDPVSLLTSLHAKKES